jgi:hypothetical protein
MVLLSNCIKVLVKEPDSNINNYKLDENLL